MINRPNLFDATLFLGGVVALSTSIVKPEFVAAPLTFIGGAMAGAAAVERRKNNEEEVTEKAARVSGVFRSLYETNRGLISASQLGILADIDFPTAAQYLEALAQDTNGTRVPGLEESEVVYNFPHSANVLDGLSQNAQAWANSQITKYVQENTALVQQIEEANQRIRAAQMAQVSTPRQTVQRTTNDDLWNQG